MVNLRNPNALDVIAVTAGYGSTRVVFGVDLAVGMHQVVSVVGKNGAGKSTLLKVLAGQIPATSGRSAYFGTEAREPSRIARLGVGYMPQDGCVFPGLTVADNLRMSLGSSLGSRLRLRGERLDGVYDLFPRLRDRLNQRAGQLSGGERKMLSLCRLLLSDSKLLILDEPTEGIWPALIDRVAERLRREMEYRTVLVVEQNIEFALSLGGQCHVMDRGSIVFSGEADDPDTGVRVERLLAL